MGVASAPDLIGSLRQMSLLDAEQLAAVAKPPLAGLPPKDLARELVKLGWLTPFQVNQLLNGRGKELILGEYVLLETLGKGGMGQVYKARQRRLKRLAALKVIRKEFLRDPTTVQRFLREAESAARLAHPNIVSVYDAGEAHGVHYLAMEFIDGTNLGDRLKDGPMPVATACNYVRQAALGLQHAHEQGMVHRDLKPHNLMLTKQGLVKVLDLGLARLVQQASAASKTEAMTEHGTVLGTPDYISPEQAMNSRTIDIRADIYSLGCTLYHLLAGRPPFRGESMTETLLKHHLEEPTRIEELRNGLPEGLPDVLRTLMAKRPDDRYPTPAEAAEALAPYASGGTPPPPSRRKTAAKQKRPMLVPLLLGAAALVGLLVLTVGAIGAYFLLRSPGTPRVAQTPSGDRTRPLPDPDKRPKDSDLKVKDSDKRPKDFDKSAKDSDKKPPDPEEKTPKPPDVSKLPLVFQDDFSTPGGFPVRKEQGHESGYANGRYFIRASAFAGWHNGKTYSNFACKLVGKVTGPPVASWGLCLACPQEKFRGIFVRISRDGKVAVTPSPFAQEGAAGGPNIAGIRHKAIKPGDQTNELLVVVHGKKVEIFVNAQSVLQPLILDKELNAAFTCMMVYTVKQEGRAEFENLTVWSLDSNE